MNETTGNDLLESMGIPLVPLTFPTLTVQTYMKQSGVTASTSEIDRMWEAYKEATVKDGVTPYSPDKSGGQNLPIIVALENKTGYARARVVAYLNAVVRAVQGGWGWRWLDPKAATNTLQETIQAPLNTVKQVLTGVGEAAGGFLKPVADPVTNLVKWAAVGLVGGAIIYGLYQASIVVKARKRMRKGK